MALAVVAQARHGLPAIELSPNGPRATWARSIPVDSEYGVSLVCHSDGVLCWGVSTAVDLDPRSGKTRWKANYSLNEPPCSRRSPEIFEFGNLLVVSQGLQGKSYFVSVTAIDKDSGQLLWHRLYETSLERCERAGDRLFVDLNSGRREIALADGSLSAREKPRSLSAPSVPAVNFPDGPPSQSFPWHGGVVAFYEYENFAMDLGEMAGVHGLQFLKLSGGVWLDQWHGAWMARHRGETQSHEPKSELYVLRVLEVGRELWISGSGDESWHILGIDTFGNARPLHPDLKVAGCTALTTKGIFTVSDGWLWLADERHVKRLRPARDGDEDAQLSPFGLLRVQPQAGDGAGRAEWIVSLSPVTG